MCTDAVTAPKMDKQNWVAVRTSQHVAVSKHMQDFRLNEDIRLLAVNLVISPVNLHHSSTAYRDLVLLRLHNPASVCTSFSKRVKILHMLADSDVLACS